MNNAQFTSLSLLATFLVLIIVLAAASAGTPVILALLGAPVLVAGITALAVRRGRNDAGTSKFPRRN